MMFDAWQYDTLLVSPLSYIRCNGLILCRAEPAKPTNLNKTHI